MSFNPPVTWSELEARLSGRMPPDPPAAPRPAPPAPPRARHGGLHVPYAELHAHSNASFLDGASPPEQLVEAAAQLGLEALAITDHDGMYGAVRFAEAAREVGLPTVFGAELTLLPEGGLGEAGAATGSGWRQRSSLARTGPADPPGEHLLALARGPEGYARLCRAISEAQLAGAKGEPRAELGRLAELAGGHWLVLTGCRKGAVPRALVDHGPSAAEAQLDRLVAAFGREHVAVELTDGGDPLDSARNDVLARLAVGAGLDVVATGNVHYARPSQHRLAAALAAVRARRSLDELDGWLPAGGGAHLRSGYEQEVRFVRWPGAVERAAALGRELAFDLALVAPRLPDFPVPDGHTEMSYLRALVAEGATRRYGPRGAERVPGAWRQLDDELAIIDRLGYEGYFLIVWDIVEFCRREDIWCQGRGSAANSAVCYALGITRADAVALGLLFERFLSEARDGPPDIDLDIEAGRREEVIQYVYDRYGRDRAAQVANVITYRPRSALRDMGRALGYDPGQLDAWSRRLDDPWSQEVAGDGVPADVAELARAVQRFPRHLGIHSGGMVICDRPVTEVCPVEWATMRDRSVLQWDKDDCAAAGLVKFDLLGLGMLTAMHLTVDLVRDALGEELDLAGLPQEPAVYERLARADSIGVFQVESRAQMATLPRLRPRQFYDLVVEVALIRPGPIQGGSVHPYLRRRNGQERVAYPHPLLERALAKTLGVPLFQEQMMQIAVDAAGFTAAEADQLRQAMGSKRSPERMERLRGRCYQGMAERGITGAVADQVWAQMAAFADFGFPESHSVSFAYLVYSSAWLKLHYPAAFLAGLLNAQPMGFWSPRVLVDDARRHGVEVNGPDVNASAATATLRPVAGDPDPAEPDPERRDGGLAVRLGLAGVRDVGEDLAESIAEGRPYESMEDLVRRTGIGQAQLEALATAGALGCFGLGRREALWAAGPVSQARADRLPGVVVGADAPRLPSMTVAEVAAADLWATGVPLTAHPLATMRARLDEAGAKTAATITGTANGTRVLVGGLVTHRQHPHTAGGTVFLNLEDETGLVNVICSPPVWRRYRRVARTSPALLIRGRLEREGLVVNLIAERIEALTVPGESRAKSRDFR